MIGYPWFNIGRQNRQRPHIAAILGSVVLGQGLGGDAAFIGAMNDLIIHVSDIADIGDLKVAIEKVPPDDIKSQRASRMADVRPVINRWAAEINANAARLQWNKVYFFTLKRVKESNHVVGKGRCCLKKKKIRRLLKTIKNSKRPASNG